MCVGAALLCGGRCGEVVGSQILIGYEPKVELPVVAQTDLQPKTGAAFCLRDILCLCVRL